MSTRQPTLPFPAVDPLIASDLFFNFEHSNLGVPAIDCNCLIDSDHPEGGLSSKQLQRSRIPLNSLATMPSGTSKTFKLDCNSF